MTTGFTDPVLLAGTLSQSRFSAAILNNLRPNALGVIYDEMELLNTQVYIDSDPNSGADKTLSIQSFLNYCHILAVSMTNQAFDDIICTRYIVADFPPGKYYISSPLVLLPWVRMNMRGDLISIGTGGGSNYSWDGTPTALALNNPYQPMLIVGPKSSIQNISCVGNSDGVPTHMNSGIVAGKVWSVATATPGAAGSGYVVGDIIAGVGTMFKAPFAAASFVVATVNGTGGILSVTLNTNGAGAYPFPIAIQKLIWSSGHNFTVFDSMGTAYIMTGGTGTGATLLFVYQPDFVGLRYNSGTLVVGDTYIGTVRSTNIGENYDSGICGPQFALMWVGYNHRFDDLELSHGYYGVYNTACDVRGNKINVVCAKTGLVVFGSASFECPTVVLDTCQVDSLTVDQSSSVILEGVIFFAPSSQLVYPSSPSNPYQVCVGQSTFSSGVLNCNIHLTFSFVTAGAMLPLGSPAAAFLSYSRGSTFHFDVQNGTKSTAVNTPAGTVRSINRIADIGSYFENTNVITGSITGQSAYLFGGITQAVGYFYFTGNPAAGDTIVINSVTSTFVTGGAVTPQINIGATMALTMSNVVAYINSNPSNLLVTSFITPSLVNLTAITPGSAGNAIVISRNCSVISYSIMRGGCAGLNCGVCVWDSSVGAWCGSNGIYSLEASGPPPSSTGLNKAGSGTTYTDTSSGTSFLNMGSDAAPFWSRVTMNNSQSLAGSIINAINVSLYCASDNTATVITTINNGFDGQDIYISLINPSNGNTTSIGVTGNIVTNSGSITYSATKPIIHLKCLGNKWYQT